MVTGMHTAWRCKQCGEVFFTPHTAAGLLSSVKQALHLLACPKCGSKDVHEDKGIRT